MFDQEDILTYNTWPLKIDHSQLEEIVMKNGNDLQQNLNQLLPPEPVFLSTIFLLQDAENIFEMQPAERLIVLKNVFGLLGIDEAKEQVNEERKQTENKIKYLQDQSLQNSKLNKRLAEAYELNTHIHLPQKNTFFEDLHPLIKQLSLQDFSLNGLELQLYKEYFQQLQSQEKELIADKAKQEQLQKQISEKSHIIKEYQEKEKKLNEEIAHLEQRIASIDVQKIETIKQEKLALYEQINTLDTMTTPLLFEDLKAEDLEEVIVMIQKLKDKGKELANLAQIQQLKQEELAKAKERLANFDLGIQTEAQFFCEAINDYCKCIKSINKQHFEQLEQQRQSMEAEIKKLESWLQTEYQKPIQPEIDSIKHFLISINFSAREEKYQKKNALQKQLQNLDQQIIQRENELQKLQKYQQEKSAWISRATEINKQILSFQAELAKLEEEKHGINAKLTTPEVLQLTQELKDLQQFLQIIENIQQLINDFTETKNTIKHLELRKEKLKNLYTILSRELLFSALETDLPILSEIINSYLTQVVDYQISMQVVESGEKIELEVKIKDAKGEREVKSLSWGQKTILKLVWMLAISSYLNTPILFLDETINNLDADTVGKVSEMINNFVKQRTMKFYTVTHNQEIQDMDIRDQIIEINNN